MEFQLSCSMLEIYKEKLVDLLLPEDEKAIELRIKESPLRGIYIEGITEEYVGTADELLEVIEDGNNRRTISSTNMNS